ncbi:hypothetical protein CEV31_1126 [Brucella thiophenivorans]|uniref:Uncharacterized protein n=1 Tax=Brucella thiophenivorans TaxID=571255 RepID=A0A256FY71_9HYPH|nr:hypothetical protein CEV31_1126 [Brucella thiophenivorans]
MVVTVQIAMAETQSEQCPVVMAEQIPQLTVSFTFRAHKKNVIPVITTGKN